MSRQYFNGVDGADAAPASHTAISATTSATNLWNPALWSFIPAFDMRPGKVYRVRAGGVYTTTATPTIIFTPRFGQSATPASNLSLGASNTYTLPTIGSSKNFYLEFIMAVRQLGVAASGATVTGTGYVHLDGGTTTAAGITLPMGGTVATTADHTTAQGLVVDVTWGTNSASNSIQAQWQLLSTEN